jgi:hypothetical protein
MNGGLVQLLDTSDAVIAQSPMNAESIQTFTFAPYTCELSFEGGGWVLVRRVKQGASWHPATDDLAGTDVYGTYGTPTSDATFSVAFSAWISQTTEFLFISGTAVFVM